MSSFTAEDEAKLEWLSRLPMLPVQEAMFAELDQEIAAEEKCRGCKLILSADDLNWCLKKLTEIHVRNPVSIAGRRVRNPVRINLQYCRGRRRPTPDVRRDYHRLAGRILRDSITS